MASLPGSATDDFVRRERSEQGPRPIPRATVSKTARFQFPLCHLVEGGVAGIVMIAVASIRHGHPLNLAPSIGLAMTALSGWLVFEVLRNGLAVSLAAAILGSVSWIVHPTVLALYASGSGAENAVVLLPPLLALGAARVSRHLGVAILSLTAILAGAVIRFDAIPSILLGALALCLVAFESLACRGQSGPMRWRRSMGILLLMVLAAQTGRVSGLRAWPSAIAKAPELMASSAVGTTAIIESVDPFGIVGRRLPAVIGWEASMGAYIGTGLIALALVGMSITPISGNRIGRRLPALVVLGFASAWLMHASSASPHQSMIDLFAGITLRTQVHASEMNLVGLLCIPLFTLPLILLVATARLIAGPKRVGFTALVIGVFAAWAWWRLTPGGILQSHGEPLSSSSILLSRLLLVFALTMVATTGLDRWIALNRSPKSFAIGLLLSVVVLLDLVGWENLVDRPDRRSSAVTDTSVNSGLE